MINNYLRSLIAAISESARSAFCRCLLIKNLHFICCKVVVCRGCEIADRITSGGDNYPFCREPAADDDEENYKRIMKRVKANDPAAMRFMGTVAVLV